MTPDIYLFIFSIIFCFFCIFSGAWWRYKKYGIPFKETFLMLWQEVVVNGLKELRKNFVPTTKKAIDVLREWYKNVSPAIADYLRPKPIKHTFTLDLYYGLLDVIRGFANMALQFVINFVYFPLPSYIYVSLYTKHAITEDDKDEIVWAVTAKFREYMNSYSLSFQNFAVPYVEGNHIEVLVYYCECQSEYAAFQTKRNQVMQMKAEPAFRPLTVADLPKTSDIVLGYSYEKWTTTGQVVPILWDVAAAPHVMVSGPTGGGKSIYTKLLISQILEAGASVCVCDYKGHFDYRGLVKDFAAGSDCDALLARFCADFEQTREQGEDGKWKVLVFDEFGSFAASKSKKEFDSLMNTLANVIFMGRSYGYSAILISQRFDAETIKTSYREQCIKVFMGSTISQQSATILFPNSEVDKSTRLPPCCGYISTPKTDCDTIIIPKVDIAALDRHLKALGENADEQRD